MPLRMFCLSLLVLALAGAGVAFSAEAGYLGATGAWQAYRIAEKGKRVCYMVAKAKSAPARKKKKKSGKSKASTRPAYAMVTFRPTESMLPVFSYIAGRTLKKGSEAAVRIDKDRFNLFTAKDTGWTRTSAGDREVTEAVVNGARMRITAKAANGTRLRHVFSLKGSFAAYRKIRRACGIPK